MDITDYGAIGQIAVAFAAGLVSFLSPCVLPLVPGYISIVSGSSLDQLKAREKDTSLLRTVLLNSVMFIVGFSLTFIPWVPQRHGSARSSSLGCNYWAGLPD